MRVPLVGTVGPRKNFVDTGYFFLLVLAIATAAAAIAGYNRGWAYGELNDIHAKGIPTSLSLKLALGWWNATSELSSDLLPGSLEVETRATRGLGLTTAILFGVGILFTIHLLHLSLGEIFPAIQLPHNYQLLNQQRAFVTGVAGFTTLVLTVALYLWLAIRTRNEMHDKFGDDVALFPRPDWASICGLVSALSWLAISRRHQAVSDSPEGYLPV